MEYTFIRSKRKTVSLEIKNGELIVRAPNRYTKRQADEFVKKHEAWIEKNMEKIAQRKAAGADVPRLSGEELRQLADKAMEYIPGRVRYYAEKMGLSCGRITQRGQKTK